MSSLINQEHEKRPKNGAFKNRRRLAFYATEGMPKKDGPAKAPDPGQESMALDFRFCPLGSPGACPISPGTGLRPDLRRGTQRMPNESCN